MVVSGIKENKVSQIMCRHRNKANPQIINYTIYLAVYHNEKEEEDKNLTRFKFIKVETQHSSEIVFSYSNIQ